MGPSRVDAFQGCRSWIDPQGVHCQGCLSRVLILSSVDSFKVVIFLSVDTFQGYRRFKGVDPLIFVAHLLANFNFFVNS